LNFYQQRLSHLRNLGFCPKVIYDIGACRATWMEQAEPIFPNSQFYFFEANEDNRPFLEKKGRPFFMELLGNQEQLTTFYVTKIGDGGGNSAFKENSTFYSEKNCEKRILPMRTLSSLVKKYQLPQPELVKIDVQGAEKAVIEGGIDVILGAEVVILEVQLLQYNDGAPLFLEIANLMDRLGFQMVDMLEIIYSPCKKIINIDIVFFKKTSQLIQTDNFC
jgi:FkbM family methyltransferase